MKFSDRDKKLILYVLIALIAFGAYKLQDKFSTENIALESEQRELSEKYNELNSMNARKESFKADTKANNDKLDDLYNQFGTSVAQENIIMFLKNVEQNTGVWLKEIGYDKDNLVYRFGEITSSNPAKQGQSVYTSTNLGYSRTLSVSYECSYDELKDVLTYLRENGKKTSVTNVTFTYSQANDTVSGTMTIGFYAIMGDDRKPVSPDIYEVPVGTGNIFASDTFIPNNVDSSYKDKIISDYDLYLIMNPVGSDMNTVVVGQAGDATNSKALTSDKTVENVTIHLTGKEGEYRVKYKTASSAYPEEKYDEGTPIVFGDDLDLLIISKPRIDSKDGSEVHVTIINETDVVLNYAVVNDDPEKPRIIFEERVGDTLAHE